jgi:alpha-ketoglutarate-dependent taurine dioxygenase
MSKFAGIMSSLSRQGWAIVDGVTSSSEMIEVAHTLGQPIPAPTGQLVKPLSPTDRVFSRGGTLSESHGRGEIPFHTDTAFWPCPSRYLVFRVAGDRRRETTLLHFEQIWLKLGMHARTAVERSVWRTPRYAGGIYCSMRFWDGKSRGWRFDPKVMIPVNVSARQALEEVAHAIAESTGRIAIEWQETDCVVVDNWNLLHARGASPHQEGDRVLFRIYVR